MQHIMAKLTIKGTENVAKVCECAFLSFFFFLVSNISNICGGFFFFFGLWGEKMCMNFD